MPKGDKQRKRVASVLAAPAGTASTLLTKNAKRSSLGERSPAMTPRGGSSNAAVPSSSNWLARVAMDCIVEEKVPFARSVRMLQDSGMAILLEEELKGTPSVGEARPTTPPLERASVPSNSAPQNVGASGRAAENEFSTPEGSPPISDPDDVEKVVNEVLRRRNIGVTTADVCRSPSVMRAIQLLQLAIALMLDRGDARNLKDATELAEKVASTHRSPHSVSLLGWTSYQLSKSAQETTLQASLQAAALGLVSEASAQFSKQDHLGPLEVYTEARNCWVLALLGSCGPAILLAEKIISMDRTRLDVFLLLALLHSSTGRYDYSLNVLQHASYLHPNHIALGIVTTAVKQASGELPSADDVEHELVVSLARVQALHAFTRGSATLDSAVQIIGNWESDWSNLPKLQLRALALYALLADVALQLKSQTVAELAIDAGLDLIGTARDLSAPDLHSALLTSRAILWIEAHRRIQELHVQSIGAAHMHRTRCSKTHSELQCLTDTNVLQQAQALLERAIELSSGNAEAYCVLGEKWLLCASVPWLQEEERRSRLAKAAFELRTAVRCDVRCWKAYDCLGRVREAQGALDISADVLQCAAQLSSTAPLIAFKKVAFLVEA